MILVKTLTMEVIETTIADLIAMDQLELACQQLNDDSSE